MIETLAREASIRLPGKSDRDVPDFMGSSSSLSFDNSFGDDSFSFYQSCNGSFNQSFQSCSSGVSPTFLDSGFFAKKQRKAAKKIQALARGFLVRLECVKAPAIAALADVQRLKEEELEQIELGKLAEMEKFRLEMERELDLVDEPYAEAKQVLMNLKEEHSKYKEENATLKLECKDLKKLNKQLIKDCKKDSSKSVEVAMEEERIVKLMRQNAQSHEAALKCLEHMAVYRQRIQEAEQATKQEKDHTERLNACISGVFDLVEQKNEKLSKKLWKIVDKNNVFVGSTMPSYYQ